MSRRTPAGVVRFVAESLFAAFFPADCRLCNRPLTSLSRLPVCDSCLDSVQPIGPSACSVCGDLLSGAGDISGTEARVCLRCQQEHPRYDVATAFGVYDGALRELVHLLKYERIVPAARTLGEALAKAIRKHGSVFTDPVLLIPVPLHKSRQRERRFNQTEQIARAAMRAMRELPLEFAPHALRRIRATESQTGFTREQRRRNLRGAFAVTDAARIRGRSVLLVDDVLTTGATTEECARMLRRAGATTILVSTVARAVSHEERPRLLGNALQQIPAMEAASG